MKRAQKKGVKVARKLAPVRIIQKSRSAPKVGGSSVKLTSMMEYDRMIRDPCAAAPARAPYQGTDSGYLARTVDSFTVSWTAGASTVGTIVAGDVIFQLSPRLFLASTVGPQAGGALAGSTITVANLNPPASNFVYTTAQKWRAVAACLKWVPTGPHGTRAGVVSLGYSPSLQIGGGSTQTANSIRSSAMETAPNGSIAHEVRWLPAAADQNWGGAGSNSSDDQAGAVVFASLSNIDSQYTTTTNIVALGYFECTVIWEWAPATAGSLTVMPVPPPAFTINEHQSTIGSMGDYLLRGIRKAISLPGVQAAGQMILTKGYQAITRGAPALALMAA